MCNVIFIFFLQVIRYCYIVLQLTIPSSLMKMVSDGWYPLLRILQSNTCRTTFSLCYSKKECTLYEYVLDSCIQFILEMANPYFDIIVSIYVLTSMQAFL